jgi:hypothetical protein
MRKKRSETLVKALCSITQADSSGPNASNKYEKEGYVYTIAEPGDTGVVLFREDTRLFCLFHKSKMAVELEIDKVQLYEA